MTEGTTNIMGCSSMHSLDMKDQILAGMDFRIQYLGSGELSKSGGTDDEIAGVIHDIHGLYAQRKSGVNKAFEVVVYIDTQRINVYNKDESKTLLNFPLTQVRDVTACLKGPAQYSKTCVLVAKENNEPLYKAYLFYCKTVKKAEKFYQAASLAFRLGFELLNEFSNSTAVSCEQAGMHRTGTIEIITKDLKECEIKEIKSGSIERDGQNIASENNNGKRERTVAVQLESKKGSAATWKNEKGHMKIYLDIDEPADDNLPDRSMLRVYVENIEEGSRFFLPHWFRSSYRKFRKFSSRQSTDEFPDEVQL